MIPDDLPPNPYVLLTPGPLSTTKGVRAAMLRDWCTWDDDFGKVVQDIRARLTALATAHAGYTSVLMQGSGTFCVEATLGTVVPPESGLLVVANGAYGERMGTIAARLGIPHRMLRFPETEACSADSILNALRGDDATTHVAVVHCETTTGLLNPLERIAAAVRESGRTLIVDAMSSFGGIPLDVGKHGIDFLISSANKCIQGVPGFGFVIARREALAACKGRSRSLSLDLHDQWVTMEEQHGKWRFTAPTHTVHAFSQALDELRTEGGVGRRHKRYSANAGMLVKGMQRLGFECLLPEELRSPIITTFRNPADPAYAFPLFYNELKQRGFVIYPGKVSNADTFRVGTIGDVTPTTIRSFLTAAADSMYWKK